MLSNIAYGQVGHTFAYVTNSGSDSVSVIDVADRHVVATIAVGVAPTGIAVTPDGQRLLVTNSGGDSVSFVSTVSRSVVATIAVGVAPGAVAISPDGSRAYVANTGDDTISVIDLVGISVVSTIDVGSLTFNALFPLSSGAPPSSHLAVTPDGNRVYITNTYPFNQPLSSSLKVLDTATNALLAPIQLTSRNSGSVVLSRDGSRGYVSGWFGYFEQFDPATNLETDAFSLSGGNSGISLSGIAVPETGNHVYVAASEQNRLYVIDSVQHASVGIPVGAAPNGVALSPGDAFAYVANRDDGTVSIVDTTSQDVETVAVGTRPAEIAFATSVELPDTTAPDVVCAEVDTLWHGMNQSFSCTAADEQSGLANESDAAFSLSTNVVDGNEDAAAATDARTVCDRAGNCAAEQLTGIKIDRRAPSISITAPAGGAQFVVGQMVAAQYECTDAGSGVASCTGSSASGAAIPTSSVGAQNFTVAAADAVGNTRTSSAGYTVAYGIDVRYDVNKAYKIGSTLPLQIRLADAVGTNLSASDRVVTATQVFLTSTSAPGLLEDSGNANPDLNFRFADGEYIFNLSLKEFVKGTYGLRFVVSGDPIEHTLYFQTK